MQLLLAVLIYVVLLAVGGVAIVALHNATTKPRLPKPELPIARTVRSSFRARQSH
jgi:hypothetical protein